MWLGRDTSAKPFTEPSTGGREEAEAKRLFSRAGGERLLEESVRRALWVVVVGTLFLAAGELLLRFGEKPLINAAHAGCLVALLALLGLLRRCRGKPCCITVALLAAVTIAATSATVAILSGRSTTSTIVFVGLSMGAAAFVPWGGRAQLACVSMLSLVYLFEIYQLNDGSIPLSYSREIAGLYVVLLGSVYIAYEIQRQRRVAEDEYVQRLQREAEIERQRAFLHQVIDINPHLIFAKDRNGRFTLCNQALAEVYGGSVEQIIGKTDADFNPNREEVEHFRADDLEVIDSGREKHIPEEVVTDARGRQRYLETIKRPLRSPSGSCEQVLGVATDITARKLAEEALREESQLNAKLAQIGRDLIASLNRPNALHRICQLTAEAIDGDLATMWVFEPDLDAYVAVGQHGFPPERWEELRVVRLSPTVVQPWLERFGEGDVVGLSQEENLALATPAVRKVIPEARQFALIGLRRGGNINGAIVVSYLHQHHSLSERQIRLARSIAHLASLGLENTRLMDQLDRANRLKSEFVATMSHELRTPLNVILGYETLLREGAMGELDTEQVQTLERIHENALQLLDLVTATLDMSRLEAGRVHLDVQPVDLREVMAELAVQMREARVKDGVHFRWRVPEDTPPLLTDPVKLKVILTNLLTNAFKFTSQGDVTVTAAATDGHVEIVVSDTGIGIAPEAQAAIFEPFRQADRSIGARYGGVGLGLYIVRRLVEILGGSIEVASKEGEGSTFRVHLPVQVCAENSSVSRPTPLIPRA